jgi:hypothetical protein
VMKNVSLVLAVLIFEMFVQSIASDKTRCFLSHLDPTIGPIKIDSIVNIHVQCDTDNVTLIEKLFTPVVISFGSLVIDTYNYSLRSDGYITSHGGMPVFETTKVQKTIRQIKRI